MRVKRARVIGEGERVRERTGDRKKSELVRENKRENSVAWKSDTQGCRREGRV